ncbi:hypothetical protein D7Y13_05595 [Corallococcus praedator]|uniref:Lipoprotein n=1 Tax=Corallococcus praedator TaxID=2316724 RepID=A0ABX9QNJ6_9BACT|nr:MULTISPECIES: hypothetical protein [Corallococcus]RKH33659.1 hypothetical protein D7X75_11275 [Corallococcus sp. CA031C]RKI14668.1 hypothetical protein D7Y13_05595 [Corallococcus praedator]
MNKFTRAVCLGSALVVSACGGPEPVEEASLAQQEAAFAVPATATAHGCNFTLYALDRPNVLPPTYDIKLNRFGSTCPYGDLTVVLGTSYSTEPKLSMQGNALGVALSYSVQSSYSGSAARYLVFSHVDPATLAVVRNADIRGDYPYGQVNSGNVWIESNGTTVTVNGVMSGTIQGRPGTRYTATFPDFFTSTTAPSYYIR